jgi:ribose transport system substrate-binding protein
MKRSTAIAATAALCIAASALAGCTASPGKSNKLTIAFVTGAASDPFYQAMKAGAVAEGRRLDVNVTFQGDATTFSAATQIPIVNQVLATKPDGFALTPTDPIALQSAVVRAKAQGIPVVNTDTRLKDLSDVVSYVTGDNTDGGRKAADALAKSMGYTSGKTYQVVVGLTSSASTTNSERLDGFKKQVAAKYPGIEIVATGFSQSNPATANTNVNNWLTAFPALRGIFAIDGTNASGAAAALQAKGLVGKIGLVGYDAYKDNVDLMKKGVFSALIAQDPAKEGQLAVRALVDTINKKGAPKKTVTLPNIVLDKSTSAADLTKYTYVAAN